MQLTEIYVNDNEVAGEYIAQAFFEWEGQEWELTIKAPSKEEAENQATSQADAYLQAWVIDQNAANDKFGVYMF